MAPFLRPEMASFCKNPKITFLGSKKKSKNRKKFFFSGLPRTTLKLPKKSKTRNSDRYSSIQSDFLTRFLDPKICKFDTKIVKNPEFQDFSTCRGWLGRDRNRKNPKSPKMGKTTQELSQYMILGHLDQYWSRQVPFSTTLPIWTNFVGGGGGVNEITTYIYIVNPPKGFTHFRKQGPPP